MLVVTPKKVHKVVIIIGEPKKQSKISEYCAKLLFEVDVVVDVALPCLLVDTDLKKYRQKLSFLIHFFVYVLFLQFALNLLFLM